MIVIFAYIRFIYLKHYSSITSTKFEEKKYKIPAVVFYFIYDTRTHSLISIHAPYYCLKLYFNDFTSPMILFLFLILD